MEVYLYNNGLLMLSVQSFFTYFSRLIIVGLGIVEFLAAVGLIFFEEREKRVKFIALIVALTLFDAFVMHNPFVEHGKPLHYETKHCLLSLTIASSLLMVGGYRKY